MLKEIAKVLVGVLIAEMFFFIWLIARDMLPIDILGMEVGFTVSMITILTDFTLVILLSYYAWIRKPAQKKTSEAKTEEEWEPQEKKEA